MFADRKTVIHTFAFVSILSDVTGHLSCQIFLMTCVNWLDKELRPVADSVSFGTDNIGSDIQRSQNWYPIDRHRCDPMPIFGRVPLMNFM